MNNKMNIPLSGIIPPLVTPLLDDDVLSFQPYFMEQKNPSAAAVELNTMRLMEDRPARFVVTEKATGKKVFDINLTDFLILTSMEGNKMKPQEYLDREDEYKISYDDTSSCPIPVLSRMRFSALRSEQREV